MAAEGYYPLTDSLPAFGNKVDFTNEMSPLQVVSQFRQFVMIAIAKEDHALDERRGGLGYIFWNSVVQTTSVPEARAGAAVIMEAFEKYCEQRGITDKQAFLERHGTKHTDAEMYLQYASHILGILRKLEVPE